VVHTKDKREKEENFKNTEIHTDHCHGGVRNSNAELAND
jgi:hypothetical protein